MLRRPEHSNDWSCRD